MKANRRLAVLAAIASIAAACGGGERGGDEGLPAVSPPAAATDPVDTAGSASGPVASEPAPPTTGGGADPCAGVELEATDVGITAGTIVVEILADTGAQSIPGMANGSVEAVRAWAELVNEQGGLACRRVEVREFDSKINPDESRNGYLDGCENALAMVGTFALAVADVTPLAQCEDAAGAPTGLPELPGITTNPLHHCNSTTFALNAVGLPCPAVAGTQSVTVSTATGEYMKSVLGDEAHGLFLLATTSPLTIGLVMPSIRFLQAQGLAADVEAGGAGTDPQSHYTPYAAAVKDRGSQFLWNTATFPTFLQLLGEVHAQGDESVELVVCQATCYDPAYFQVGGDLAVGTRTTIAHLPFEEADINAEVAEFVDRVPTHNTFSVSSWLAARLFERAVGDVVAASGPNGLTRASLLAAIEAIEDFDANGMIGPVTPANRYPSNCLAVVNLTGDGTWVREFPAEPGTFLCGEYQTIDIDPATAFQG